MFCHYALPVGTECISFIAHAYCWVADICGWRAWCLLAWTWRGACNCYSSDNSVCQCQLREGVVSSCRCVSLTVSTECHYSITLRHMMESCVSVGVFLQCPRGWIDTGIVTVYTTEVERCIVIFDSIFHWMSDSFVSNLLLLSLYCKKNEKQVKPSLKAKYCPQMFI